MLTQKLITQPYLEVDAVFSDDSNYAAKSGLSELKTGIKTRYEITKRIRPFIDVAYQYEKGQKLRPYRKPLILKKDGYMGLVSS